MTWPDDKLLGISITPDTNDPETARPVGFAFAWLDFGQVSRARSGLVDPGVPIPDGLPGITAADVAKRGGPLDRSIDGIVSYLMDASLESVPLIGYGLFRDLTILDRCHRRQYGIGLRDAGWEGVVFDAFVLDRGLDPERKGDRTLANLARQYGSEPPGPRWFDRTTASTAVTLAIAKRYPEIADLEPDELHGRQVMWFREWAESLQMFEPAQTDWPIFGDGDERRRAEGAVDASRISARQAADLSILLKSNHGIEDRQDRIDVIGGLVGRLIQTSRELTVPEYQDVARRIPELAKEQVARFLQLAQERRGGVKQSIIDEKNVNLLVDPDVGNASQRVVAETMRIVMAMKGSEVNDHLRDYGLPRTGNVSDRRLRFYEFACRERAAGNESVEKIFRDAF